MWAMTISPFLASARRSTNTRSPGKRPASIMESPATFNKSRTNFAYYLQERLRLLNERLFLTGGFRVDNNEDFGTQVTPSWSLAYIIPQTGTKLKGSFVEGFRAPNFNELFFPDFGNPRLGAEESSE
ncbi:MAG TPA: TonB-dependent receptor [Candidatus Binatia bacterium]|nr:TonB-dependent receptor [Candidatus Binatia bacterium]